MTLKKQITQAYDYPGVETQAFLLPKGQSAGQTLMEMQGVSHSGSSATHFVGEGARGPVSGTHLLGPPQV